MKNIIFASILSAVVSPVIIVGVMITQGLITVNAGYRYSHVCGSEVVERFNAQISHSDGAAKDKEMLLNELKNITGWDDDPTCRAMTFSLHVSLENKDAAGSDLKFIKKAIDDKHSPSIELLTTQSMQSMEQVYENMGRATNDFEGGGE
ncbi:MAG: hypothetical protein Q4A37_02775 [Candidatus Saccharibacteria bacterium]|nr:hypothetical protein [Candidatus Saccharibacteria bacterium]